MNSLKLYTYLLLVAFFSLIITSCDIFQQDSRKYNGAPIAAFEFQSEQVAAGSDTINLTVELIRGEEGMLEQDLPISFVVVDSTTTATSPDDYEVLTPSPLIMPAGSLVTSLDIQVNGAEIPAGQARVLTLQLTGNENRGVKGGEVIGVFELTIAGE